MRLTAKVGKVHDLLLFLRQRSKRLLELFGCLSIADIFGLSVIVCCLDVEHFVVQLNFDARITSQVINATISRNGEYPGTSGRFFRIVALCSSPDRQHDFLCQFLGYLLSHAFAHQEGFDPATVVAVDVSKRRFILVLSDGAEVIAHSFTQHGAGATGRTGLCSCFQLCCHDSFHHFNIGYASEINPDLGKLVDLSGVRPP